MTCVSCLKFLLKVTNYLLLFVGLATVGFGIYMFKTWHDTNKSLTSIPWFIIVTFVVGLVIVVTASVGICGADCAHKSCCLNFYIFLACVILCAQIAIVVAVFIKDVQNYIPKDTSGNLQAIEEFIKKDVYVVKYGGIAIMVIEVIAVLTACILSVTDHGNRKDDDEDDYKTPLNQPYYAAGYQAGAPVQRTATDPWSKHISQKYDLDTTKFTYDPQRSQQNPAADLEAGKEQKKGGCTVM
eukprot:TRINITY_DN74_c0_g1_i1.p2 TRINITY_DN74_c0_g1~~TRINITY_DN74_c0_g1_i1.p2  ORF type:complete len:241 (-),score=37.34 TRINITY_DN74_c0_g1_i1:470-1192(-)